MFTMNDPTINDAQMIDWLASGKFALNFFARAVGVAAGKGLSVREFYAGSFREGGFVNPMNGSVSLPSQAPHPNAAKLALNLPLMYLRCAGS